MSERLGQAKSALAVTTPAGKDVFVLQRLDGEEALSEPFVYRLEVTSTSGSIQAASLVGKAATVDLGAPAAGGRAINGVVTRFVQTGRSARSYRYRLELRPWLWLLGQASSCRIFQNQSVPEIVALVFKGHGITAHRQELKQRYAKLEYVVQLNESDLAFVERLLAFWGVFYFFEHSASGHVLVLGDDPDAHAACAGLPAGTLRYKPDAQSWHEPDIVTEVAIEDRVVPGRAMLDDYNPITPQTELKAEVGDKASKRALYDWPGGHEQKADGQRLARLRVEAAEAGETLLTGETPCVALNAGDRVTLKDLYRKDADGPYVVRKVVLSTGPESTLVRFEAQPAATPFRPAVVPAKPRIAGSQTALVVGPEGKEIWTDKHGRIKVQFHWDQAGAKDDQSSLWVRVAQAWAGKSFGAFVLPRVGMEVVVSFLDGDPDRPLVTGAVYNGANVPPYALPANQTRSTLKSQTSPGGKGFNELRFEDKQGKEEVYLHAQKDLVGEVKNDRRLTIDGNDTVTVKKKRTTRIEGDETQDVIGARTLTVTKAETHNDKANFSHNVKGNYTLKVSGNLTIDVTGAISIKSGSSITSKSGTATTHKAGTSLTAQAGTGATVKSGTATMVQAGTGVTVKAGTSLTQQAGMSVETKAGMNLKSKAGMSLENEAGVSLKSKGGAMHTAEAGGIMMVKGALVKVN